MICEKRKHEMMNLEFFGHASWTQPVSFFSFQSPDSFRELFNNCRTPLKFSVNREKKLKGRFDYEMSKLWSVQKEKGNLKSNNFCVFYVLCDIESFLSSINVLDANKT